MNLIALIVRSCLYKRNLSLDKANNIVDAFAKQNMILYYYKCQLCSSYHLTKRVPDETIQGQRIA